MYSVNIEVVGTCNLRCPSCPVGNAEGGRRSGSIGGTMPLERLREALDWIGRSVADDPARIKICLFSWGEPLIHPDLPALIAEVKRRGFLVALSSNLNFVRDLDAVVRAGVDEFTVSVSGFTQAAYAVSHTGGDIEVVKRNMRELSDAIDRSNAATRVMVHYITYRHNAGAEEFSAMADLSERLGFEYTPSLAFFIPVEKLIGMAAGRSYPGDKPILDQLVVPIAEQLRISAPAVPAATCPLIEDRFDIDVDGAVRLCCASFDRRYTVAPSFAGIGFDESLRRRRASDLCGDCSARGLERIFTRVDYAAWCEYADAVFQELQSPVRCVGTTLICRDRPTESMLLGQANERLTAGEHAAAKRSFAELGERLAAKYGTAGRTAEGVLAYLRGGGRRFGRDVPFDPLRIFFLEGYLGLFHGGDAVRARQILEMAREMAASLTDAGVYGETARAFLPMIAECLAGTREAAAAD
jgi:MoaA/NifB/PqqE/SkfB family radical SAM enzyme